ncbi:hypothetical protein [Rhodoferax sp. GW822-FHT02A01]|uniref:hypothetical protein n=1 Tax=Rhodoferax sp. GW822-FHT02A01 TaxID=3141537 RepID=UPI00315DD7C2
MSRLLILFLIALLPLRGWTAQRMVLDMNAPAVVVSMQQQSGMSEDCALQMQMAALSHGDQDPGATQHAGCQSCDICMPLAALDEAPEMALKPIPHAVPVRQPGTFESAEPTRYTKPPIS